jgi:hypothetical protein
MNHQREEQQPKRTKLKNRSIERSAMQLEESTGRSAMQSEESTRRSTMQLEVQQGEVQCNQ